MEQKRPRGREKNVTDSSTGVHKRGDGLGTGPVGSSDGYSGRGQGNSPSGSYGNSSGNFGKRAATGGGISLPIIIIIGIIYFLFGRGGNSASESENAASSNTEATSTYDSGSGSLLGGLLGGLTGGTELSTSSSTASAAPSSTTYSQVDTSVASGSRAKRTRIAGNGNDVITIMTYMCGTDLESQNGMATADLQEMAAAKFGDNINLIVYTGGCKRWQLNGISNSTNQIYKVTANGIQRLVDNDGAKAMTDPNTLSSFIKWAAKNYPANRYELIFWDHGGGSVSGYGYDEKYASKGSMNLANISKALKAGGVTFDFIGFDACLMATTETALMLNDYADYMIASEETEPGIGWYYTNWLTELGNNTSLPTLDIGQRIVDDFVTQCDKRCRGQKTTLSVIDLAEFANTVPKPFSAFSKSISKLISAKNYQTVSDARYTTREFASSSKIDQIDLVDLCNNINNTEAQALSKALRGAVKYNRTSSNMTNAYGVSIYFPYKRTSYVDQACDTYEAIGLGDEYAQCIREFANLEVSGQVAAGGSSSPMSSLFGALGGGTSDSADMISQLLGAFLGGGSGSGLISGLTSGNTDFLSGRSLSTKEAANYISLHHFNPENLVWTEGADGSARMTLPESQWELVHDIDLNMFYDDGSGYVDLGLDNVFDFSPDGNTLIASTDRTWVAINGQPVTYYHLDTTEEGSSYTITGRVPAKLNGTRVNLLLVFDNEHPYGYISGAVTDYRNNETDTVAKSMTELHVGDKLDFLCDYYSYDHSYQDSYYLGETMTVTGKMEISNVSVGSGPVKIMYRFTDLYNQEYWSAPLTR